VLFIDEVEEIAGVRQPRAVSAAQGVTNEMLKLIPRNSPPGSHTPSRRLALGPLSRSGPNPRTVSSMPSWMKNRCQTG
jgi:hypothetical protein